MTTKKTTAKHTPGPWGYAKSDFDHGFSVYANGPLAHTAGADDYRECAEPNARLIAAAPDLLAALEDALSALSYVDGLDGFKAREVVRAAIAKARGE